MTETYPPQPIRGWGFFSKSCYYWVMANKKIRAEKRETKKKLKMKVSGKSVFKLKKILEKKAKSR